jgi:hypothetical protein
MKLNEQIKDYEERLKNMIVMDDYDGGVAMMLRSVVEDLKNLEVDK